MKKIFLLLVLFLLPASLFAAESVVVYAPAAMTNVMDEIISVYKKSGKSVNVSYGSSGALVKQIMSGAPAGIFIAANQDWMDKLDKEGFLSKDSRKVLVSNKLVLVSNKKDKIKIDFSKKIDFPSILKNDKLVMGSPESGPAGSYAKQAFIKLNLWESLKPYIVTSATVRESLALVSRGEAKLGVVFITDAMQDKNVAVAGYFPANTHLKIEFPVAVIKDNDNKAVREFYEFLLSSDVKKIFKKYGFII